MSFLSKIVKGKLAQKVVQEAKRPENQQKAKDAFNQAKTKFDNRKGGSGHAR
jgi:hypothetical protein